MSARFNKPPGWPQPPAGWEPTQDWTPDPNWPTAPLGWRLWLTDTGPQWPSSGSAAPPVRRSPATETATMTTATTASTAGGARPRPEPPGPVTPSVTDMIFGFPTSARMPGSPVRASSSRPIPGRMIGWGVLGMTVLAVAGMTVGSLTAPPSAPLADSGRASIGQPTVTTPVETPSAAASTDPTERAIAAAAAGTALAALADLPVQRRGPSTGYARSRFGSALKDTDRNGCDQRNDVLRRDLIGKTLKAGSNGCTVMTGTLRDPYTGRKVAYRRTAGVATRVQIDHVVPLGDAWAKGARTWSAAKRAEFATDPLNLQAIGRKVNRSKGESDAAGWLPQVSGYRCTYVARQVAVKYKYRMWVSVAERTAIARILTGCAGQELPRARFIALGGAPLARPVEPGPATAAKTRAGAASTEAGPADQGTVRPGASCAQEGDHGRTPTGTTLRCSAEAGDGRLRWRSA